MLYDVFICHASEDKDSFVRALAKELRKNHIEVWFDEFELVVGDSLRESIDKGLAKSSFGIVVLSPSFFAKNWPQRELNGLVSREMTENNPVILPIWHNITKEQILEYSPPLADKLAVDSKSGLKVVCKQLLRKLRPESSPLIIARDELIKFGLNPPIISDEWWIDVIEASNKMYPWGFNIPETAHWGRWAFYLPKDGSRGKDRGTWLAWTAMQMRWVEEAELKKITQITHPKNVLDFINSMPGLSEISHNSPEFLATWAPQLTIRGFSGNYETDFDLLLDKSVNEQLVYRKEKSEFGSALTTNGLPPACSKEIALRHPTFGDYESSYIACQFVQGELGGPSPEYYEHFEYIIWLLSNGSYWLPKKIKDFLIEGMKKWNVWCHVDSSLEFGVAFSFFYSLRRAKNFKTFKFGKKTKKSLRDWIEHSLATLEVNDNSDRILEEFLSFGFIKEYFKEYKKS